MSSCASDVVASSAAVAAAAAATAAVTAAVTTATAEASPTKSDEYGELDFVVVDEVDNLTAASPNQAGNAEVTVDANSNVTTPRVYHRREKKALALSLIDDIALQSGTPRKAPGSVADKLTPGRGDTANSPASSVSPPPSIAIPAGAAPVVTNAGVPVHGVGEVFESVPGSRHAREEEPALGFPSEKKRRQGCSKVPSRAGLVRKKAPSEKPQMASDQMLSISLPGYNWLEKKLHDVTKPVRQQGNENKAESPTTAVESAGNTASVLQNPSYNDCAKRHSEISAKTSTTSVAIAVSDCCNRNITAKSQHGEGEVIEVTDDEEPLCHWSECVIVDDELASEASLVSPHGDNEPILLPRIDTSPPELHPFQQQRSTNDAGEETGGTVDKEDIASGNHSNVIHGNDYTFTTDTNKSATQTYQHNTKHRVEEMEDKKQEDSQDDVVLLEVTPAKDADGYYSFNPFAYKTTRVMDDNFIDLCSKRNEDIESPINLLNTHVGDVTISQLKNNLSKTFDMAASREAAAQFADDQLRAAAMQKSHDFTRHQRLLAAALDPASTGFSLDRTDLDDEKQEPQISDTCQLLYRKIQSIVKSKSPEICGSKMNLAETPHGNACRSLQDAINTAMVKAMSEDFEEDLQAQAKGKLALNMCVSESAAPKQMPQRPASSGQTHLPPKKRALCMEDTAGASNVSNRSPPLSKRRKTTSRIQKVRPILLTEGEDDKGSDEVTIVKPHELDPVGEPAWPGPSVQGRPGPPGLTPDLLKANAMDLAIEREKYRGAKSAMLAPPKRMVVKKKLGRRPSLSEVPPPGLTPTMSSKALFKLDSPSTVHGVPEATAADYFYGESEEGRFVQLKDNTVAFKEIRALQEPYSASTNRYGTHVDLTGSRLCSSPAHFPPGVSHSAALASPFHKVGWPSHKAPTMEQAYPPPAAMPQAPVSQHNTYGGPTGFFECLSSRAAAASRSWAPPKPKVGPDVANDNSAGIGHAFHPVTPSNKLLPYPPYHHPSKACAQVGEQHRSVIKPQLGALHHPMVPVPAPLRPSSQLPFGLAPSPGPTQSPAHHLQNPYRTGWVPTTTPHSPRTPYPSREALAHYDPRHFMRRTSEPYSAAAATHGQMLASRFAATAAPMYQMPRQPMPRGHTPDVSQASAYWSSAAQHAALSSAPPFTKQ